MNEKPKKLKKKKAVKHLPVVGNATISFTQDQIDLIKSQIAVGATDDELNLFLYQAKKSGLDPMARQIYFVKRNGKGTLQTSIDGFRVVAERSGDYAGQDEPEFVEKGAVLDICKVRVYKWRGDQRFLAATGVAYWKEYCPGAGQDFMWKKMPHVMLSKVAEALALRKAFPQDLSGLYTTEEMAQVDVDDTKTKVAPPIKIVATKEQRQQIVELAMEARAWNKDEVANFIKNRFKLKTFNEFTYDQAEAVIKGFKAAISSNIPNVTQEEKIEDIDPLEVERSSNDLFGKDIGSTEAK